METSAPARYSISSMGHLVGAREARSPEAAVLEHLLAQGYARDEIERVAPGALSWRGAVFSAVLEGDEAEPPEP